MTRHFKFECNKACDVSGVSPLLGQSRHWQRFTRTAQFSSITALFIVLIQSVPFWFPEPNVFLSRWCLCAAGKCWALGMRMIQYLFLVSCGLIRLPRSLRFENAIFIFFGKITNFIMSRKQTPSDFLKQIIGRPVVVKLNNGVDYRGKENIIKNMWWFAGLCAPSPNLGRLVKNTWIKSNGLGVCSLSYLFQFILKDIMSCIARKKSTVFILLGSILLYVWL